MAKVSFGNGFANMMLLRMKKKVDTKQKQKLKEDKREQLRVLEEAALSAHQKNVMASTVLALAGDQMKPAKKSWKAPINAMKAYANLHRNALRERHRVENINYHQQQRERQRYGHNKNTTELRSYHKLESLTKGDVVYRQESPMYGRSKKSKKNKSKQVIPGFDHVPDGFRVPVANKPKPPKPVEDDTANLASYQKPTANARRKRDSSARKRRKKKSDIIRHATQIGSSTEHIEHGIGVVQHSDTTALHRLRRERASSIESMGQVSQTLLKMPHGEVSDTKADQRQTARRQRMAAERAKIRAKAEEESAAKARQLKTSQKLDALSGRTRYRRPHSPAKFPNADDDVSWGLDEGESPSHYGGKRRGSWREGEDEQRTKRMQALKMSHDMRRRERAGLRDKNSSAADVLAYHNGSAGMLYDSGEPLNQKIFGQPSNVDTDKSRRIKVEHPRPASSSGTISPKRISDRAGARASTPQQSSPKHQERNMQVFTGRNDTAYQPRNGSPKEISEREHQWAQPSPSAKVREGNKLERQARYASHQAATPMPKHIKIKQKTRTSPSRKTANNPKTKGKKLGKKKRKKKGSGKPKKAGKEPELKLPSVKPTTPELASAGRSLLQSYVPRREMPDIAPENSPRTRFPTSGSKSPHYLYPQRNRMHHMLFLL